MAEDKAKKTKIDLKARLSKSSSPGSGYPSSVPLPMPGFPGAPPSSDSGAPPSSSGAVPPPPPSSIPASIPAPLIPGARPSGFAPSPGISPGIPLPPFGQPRPQPRPEPKVSAQAQTIKVEVGEEVEQERAKAKKKTALYAGMTCVLGIAMGFVVGQAQSTGERARAAARGAAKLEEDVKKAGEKLKELDVKVNEGLEKLKAKQFPDDLGTALAGLTIPFEVQTLDNKSVGSLPSAVLKTVLNFTSAAEQVNKSRETLRNLIGLAKEPITKAWKEETAPVVSHSVIFRTEGKHIVAELVPLKDKEAFAWKGDFPGSYTILKMEGGKPVEKKVLRYQKGDVPGNGGEPVAIPMDPKSMAGLTNEVLVGRLMKAMYDMRAELEGNGDPQNGTTGLVKLSEDLAAALRKASLNQ